ncbi:glycosyltransferase family 4 protein [Niallia sp. FSL K6-0077]|uniref:glycosyltransferase family 4 protein n=1 Tax=Niallia sp. FSL K6-0077 TaxID=2954743 RepID=UPI0030F98438
MFQEKIYILHEYGAPRHFESLSYLYKENNTENNIIYVEFSVIRQFIKGIIKLDFKKIKRSIRNLYYLIILFFQKDNNIVIGAAPYDIFIFYLYKLKKKNRIIYYSSWPYWDKQNYPKRVYFKKQIEVWEKFLNDINVVAVTNKVKQSLQKYTEKITVIPHCINENIFSLDKERKFHKRLLFVGRLTKSKGVDQIINILKKGNMKNAEWWFVGDGELKNEIINLEASSEIKVKYLGFIKEQKKLAEIYEQCDLLLLPSIKSKKWEELFGIVLIEAMSLGVVPIASDNIGPKQIIEDCKDGLIFSSGSEEQLENKISMLLEDNLLLETLSTNAREKIASKYTIGKNSKKWDAVLKDLIQGE